MSIRERFYAKVHIPQDADACWEWRSILSRGYGRFLVNGRMRRAHRVAWELAHGPIPDGMHVCHSCDNPRCVRVSHLWLGTIADNMADRDRKGRGAVLRGEDHGCAKLTPEAVQHIRATPKKYGSGRALARLYGVSESAVSDIRIGRSWDS
jgi:hypothetical protein